MWKYPVGWKSEKSVYSNEKNILFIYHKNLQFFSSLNCQVKGRKVFPQLNHVVVLNVIPKITKGPENQKRKKVIMKKRNVIKKNKQKVIAKMQKKLKSYLFNYKINQKI